MTSKALLRKGWCPGARRPMPAKDGLLLRLRISGGSVAAATLRGIAHAGLKNGNGLFDLSARGNLQIRGVHERSLPALIETLEGFGLLDENAAIEAVRNVLVSPLAGLDGWSEALEVAKALEATLAADRDLHALPGKFGFLIDDGSGFSLGSIPADIRFDWTCGKESFAIGIGGSAHDAVLLGNCRADEILQIAARLARAFLKLSSAIADPPRRMRDLIESCGAQTIAQEARLFCVGPAKRGAIEDPYPLGLLRFSNKSHFGAGVAFGRFDANMLDAAATAAEIFGAGEIRLTPWRALIVPHVAAEHAQALAAHFAAHGFIIDPKDERLAVAACGGATACERGTTDTRADALALMSLARNLRTNGIALHVSGCAKGCARQAASVTLIAHEGLYDLVTDETARAAGLCNAQRLSLAGVHERLAVIARISERGSETEQR